MKFIKRIAAEKANILLDFAICILLVAFFSVINFSNQRPTQMYSWLNSAGAYGPAPSNSPAPQCRHVESNACECSEGGSRERVSGGKCEVSDCSSGGGCVECKQEFPSTLTNIGNWGSWYEKPPPPACVCDISTVYPFERRNGKCYQKKCVWGACGQSTANPCGARGGGAKIDEMEVDGSNCRPAAPCGRGGFECDCAFEGEILDYDDSEYPACYLLVCMANESTGACCAEEMGPIYCGPDDPSPSPSPY